jgi:hypothetical protein
VISDWQKGGSAVAVFQSAITHLQSEITRRAHASVNRACVVVLPPALE